MDDNTQDLPTLRPTHAAQPIWYSAHQGERERKTHGRKYTTKLASVEGAGRSGLTASVNAYLVLVYTTESLKSTWVCTQSLGNMSPASA